MSDWRTLSARMNIVETMEIRRYSVGISVVNGIGGPAGPVGRTSKSPGPDRTAKGILFLSSKFGDGFYHEGRRTGWPEAFLGDGRGRLGTVGHGRVAVDVFSGHMSERGIGCWIGKSEKMHSNRGRNIL